MTWIINRESIFAIIRSSLISTLIVCSTLFLLIWRRASFITSTKSSPSIGIFSVPSSILVTDRRFSTRFISHIESSYISSYRSLIFSLLKVWELLIKTEALPEIEVSGVLKSWDIALKRFALSCSCCAFMAACFLVSFKISFSNTIAHSPSIEITMLFSKEFNKSSSKAIPTTA